MAIHPELQKQIDAVASVWTTHTAKYAKYKAKIEQQRRDLDQVERECDGLEARISRIRANLDNAPPETRAQDERELREVEQSLATRRARILASRKQLSELEAELEAIWDVWKQI